MKQVTKLAMSVAVLFMGVTGVCEDVILFKGEKGIVQKSKIVKDPVEPKNLVGKSIGASMYIRNKTNKDWSKYKAISFRYLSKKIDNNSVMIIVGSENPETLGMDYYMKKLTINTGKWESVIIPFADFKVGRNPLGWHNVDSFSLRFSGWGQKYDKSGEYYVDDITLLENIPEKAN